MKKVIIKNKEGQQTHGAEMLDPQAWVADGVAGNWWGKPERWVLHKDEPMAEGYDEADVLEERIVEDYPAIDAVMDDTGAIVQEAISAKTHKEVKLKAEYTIEILDISDQVEQEKQNAEALAYLASTDWLIIREMDAGVPCPVDVKAKRAEARSKIVR
jgi:hypothetical protein